MAKLITVQPGQTLENIALQHCGSVDAVDRIVWSNRGQLLAGFSSDLVGGMQLVIPGEPVNAELVNGMAKEQVVPTNGKEIPSTVINSLGDYNDDHNNDHLNS